MWAFSFICCLRFYGYIVAVFAVLLRRLIFDEVDSDEPWLHKLSINCFSDNDIKEIWGVVNDRDWIHEVFNADPAASFLEALFISCIAIHGYPGLC